MVQITGDPVLDFLREGFVASPLMRELTKDARQDPYPESEAKHHHLVPRFLLRRFVSPSQPRERIMQLHVRKGRTDWASPARAASRSRFYRLTDEDGTRHQRFEHFLGRVEDHASRALVRLVAAPSALSPADRATIAMFLSLLESRTIAGLERLTELADMTLTHFHASRCADPVLFEEDYRRAIGSAESETIEQLRQEMIRGFSDGLIKLGNPKEVAIDLLLQHMAVSAQHIYQMRWDLLEAAAGSFITSDRGLAMFDPTPLYPWSGHAIMSSPGAETTIPLDPSRCLLLRPIGGPVTVPGVHVQIVDRDDVMALNLRTYGFATGYVFADRQECAVDVHRTAKRRPHAVERPRPPRQVILIDAEAGDDRLADEHRRRGWPPRLVFENKAHDYLVLDPNDRPVERSVALSVLGKKRAVRRLGTTDLCPTTMPLDTLSMLGGSGT